MQEDAGFFKGSKGHGNFLLDQGKYDEALEAYEISIQLDPKFASLAKLKKRRRTPLQVYGVFKGPALRSQNRNLEAEAHCKARELGYGI